MINKMRRGAILVLGAVTAAALTLVALPATPVSAYTPMVPYIELGVLLNDAVADPAGGVFYGTTRSDSPELPNRIVVFDSDNGDIISSHAVTGEPGALGIAADGTALYVGNNTTGALEKLTLPGFTPEWSVTMQRRYPDYLDVPEDIEVSPINADLVVASFRTPAVSPPHAGVIVATAGLVLPNQTPDHTGPSSIEFTADPTRLVGSDSSRLWGLQIDANGVIEQPDPFWASPNEGTYRIDYADGLVVNTQGDVIDVGPPVRRLRGLGTPAETRNKAVAIDAQARLVYVTETKYRDVFDTFLSVYELDTGKRVGSLDIPDNGLNFDSDLRQVRDGVFVLLRSSETQLIYPTIIGGSFGEFTPLTPERIVDSRENLGRTAGPLRPNETFEMQVGGRGGVPDTNVTAVVLNVTAANPTSRGHLKLFPTGIDRPDNSNLNFPPGRNVPNLVTVRLGTDGRVSVFNPHGSVDLIVDVAGFYSAANGPAGGRYTAVPQLRIADTRDGRGGVPVAPVGASSILPVKVINRAGIPNDATAVAINVTTARSTAQSHLTVFPDDVTRPDTSNVNFRPGSGATANQVIVRVPASGIINIFNKHGSTDVIVDVLGYYKSEPTRIDGRFFPLNPERMLDTRLSSPYPAPGWLIGAEQIYYDAIDDPESALVINITVTETVGNGHVVAFPHPGDRPDTSSINYESGQTVANHAIMAVDPSFAFENSGGRTHLIVDVFGYFT